MPSWPIAWLLALSAGPAAAQEVGDYLNLSFSGDGESPTALERFGATAKSAAALAGGVGASSGGDATWSVPVPLPPALRQPAVSLAYSSGGGLGRLGRGFSLDAGPTLRRPTGAEAASYGVDGELRVVSGGGLSGFLWQDGLGAWRWTSDEPGARSVSRSGDTFILRRDELTYTFSPRGDVDFEGADTPEAPREWLVRSLVDRSGNRVDWEWQGDRLAAIAYGGTSAVTHHVRVVFATTRRTWLWPAATATVSEVRDLEGRLVRQTLPSGLEVANTWHGGGDLLKQVVTRPNQSVLAQVSHTYGEYGLPTGYQLTLQAGNQTFGWVQAIERDSARQVARETFGHRLGAGAWTIQDVAYGWWHGDLRTKTIDGEPFTYGYDELHRIDAVHAGDETGPELEQYRYDVVGNPEWTLRSSESDHFEYDPVTRYSEVGGRTLKTAGGLARRRDTFGYDAGTGRLTSWHSDETSPQVADRVRTYAYDGAGRLRTATSGAPGVPGETVSYGYDVDDAVVTERRGTTTTIQRSGPWRREVVSGAASVTETVLGMLRVEGSRLTVVGVEPDGHAVFTTTWDPAAAGVPVTTTTDVLAAYGVDLEGQSSGASWELDGFHGAEPDADGELVHFGARHMLTRDGLWMQPEPLLYPGLTNGDLANPRGFGGLYAAGNSNEFQDKSGTFPGYMEYNADSLEGAGGGGGGGAILLPIAAGAVALASDPAASALVNSVAGALAPGNATGGDPAEARAMNMAKSMGLDGEGPGLGAEVDLDDPSISVQDGPLPGMTGDGTGTIYKVPGSGTPSGKPYIGRHDGADPARDRRSPDGRDRTQAEVVDTYDPAVPGAGAAAEQKQMDAHGGIDNLDNKINAQR